MKNETNETLAQILSSGNIGITYGTGTPVLY